MTKLLLPFLLFLFPPQTHMISTRQANKVLESSVLVRSKQYAANQDGDIQRFMSGCSGTYISSHEILTAAHCFSRPTTAIWVRGYKGVSEKAVLIKLDAKHDLALLNVYNTREPKFAKLASSARSGETVINVGSPYSFEFMLSEGVVSIVDYKDKDYASKFLITTAMINAGSSGGGAFNSKGELIGVNVMSAGGLFGWVGISMAVSLDDVKAFLHD